MHIKKLLCACGMVLLTAGLAHASMNAFLRSLNVSAAANIRNFRTQLEVHYGAPGPILDIVLQAVDRPADAAVVLWLVQHSGQPVDSVLRVYRAHRGHGWGAIARGLGVKPGSADFHALKAGNLGWSAAGARGKKASHAKERGRRQGGPGRGWHGGRGRK